MAVWLEKTVKRFIGNSQDTKPFVGVQADDTVVRSTDLPIGSTLFEEDTGDLYRWNGSQWTLPPDEENFQRALLMEFKAMRVELVALRRGMIDAGNCKEFSQADMERY